MHGNCWDKKMPWIRNYISQFSATTETLPTHTLLTQSPLPLSAAVGRSWELTQKVKITGWGVNSLRCWKQQRDKKTDHKSINIKILIAKVYERESSSHPLRNCYCRNSEQSQTMLPHVSTRSHTLLGSQGVLLSTHGSDMKWYRRTSKCWPELGQKHIFISAEHRTFTWK